jgi:hypothetical protein
MAKQTTSTNSDIPNSVLEMIRALQLQVDTLTAAQTSPSPSPEIQAVYYDPNRSQNLHACPSMA